MCFLGVRREGKTRGGVCVKEKGLEGGGGAVGGGGGGLWGGAGGGGGGGGGSVRSGSLKALSVPGHTLIRPDTLMMGVWAVAPQWGGRAG